MKGTRSTESMARLQIPWIWRELPMEERPGYDPIPLPLSALVTVAGEDARPALVYFYAAEDEKASEFEGKAFGDERIGVASRFFQCIRISSDEISDKAARRQFVPAVPAIHVLAADGRTVQTFSGAGTRAQAVLAAMNRAYAFHFTPALQSVVEAERTLLDRLDKVEAELKGIAEEMARAEAKGDTAKMKALEAEKTAAQAERDRILAEEERLVNVKRNSKPLAAEAAGR